MKACGEMASISKDRMTSRQILASFELPQLNQKVVVENELFVEVAHTNLKMKVILNNNKLAENTIDAVYRDITESGELSFSSTILRM